MNKTDKEKLQIIKELLWHDSPSPSVGFTEDATGDPDVQRLINLDRKFWRVAATDSTKKPSKVVISSCYWLAYLLSKDIRKKLKLEKVLWEPLLSEAKKNKAEIYVWDGLANKPVRVNNITALRNALKNTDHTHRRARQIQLAQNNITRDESEILDWSRIQELFLRLNNGRNIFQAYSFSSHYPYPIFDTGYLKNYDPNSGIRVSLDLIDPESKIHIKIYDDKDQKNLVKTLLEARKISGIYLTNQSQNQQSNLIPEINRIEKKFLSDVCSLKLEKIKCPDNELNNLLENLTHLNELKLDGTDIPSSFSTLLGQLKKLEVKDCQPLENLLTLCPNLTELKLSGDFKCFNRLEKLTKLELKDVPAEQVITLLNQCPNLEELIIDNVEKISFDQLKPNSKLKKVKLTNLNFDTDSDSHTNGPLQQLLSRCPNITELTTSDCENILTGENLETNNIRTLDIDYSDKDQSNLGKFLKKTPHLKELTIRRKSNSDVKPIIFSQKISCDKLEKLKIENLHLYYSAIPFTCPNLKDLELNDCSLSNVRTLDIPNKIERVKLNKTTILTRRNLQIRGLLENCKNLKELAITFSKDTKDEIDYTSITAKDCHLQEFKQLTTLNLSGSAIQDDQLHKLLLHCPNIKELNIADCEILGDFANQLPHFSQLTTINIANSPILYRKGFNNFLNSCQHIDQLTLSGSELSMLNIGGFPSNKIGSINLATPELNLCYTNISNSTLNDILLCHPDLSKLSLASCYQITKLFNPEFSFEYLAEFNLLESKIPLKEIAKFLKCCPNITKLELGKLTEKSNSFFGDLELLEQLKELKVLKELDLSNCNFLTLHKVEGILSTCKSLRTLKVSNSAIDTKEKSELSRQYPNILIETSGNQAANFMDESFPTANASSSSASSSSKPNQKNFENRSPIDLPPKPSIDPKYFDNIMPSRIDGDTSSQNKTLYARQLFLNKKNLDLDPSSLRIKVYPNIELGSHIHYKSEKHLIQSKNTFASNINIKEDYYTNYEAMPDIFCGQINIPLDQDWVALPSLTSEDEIVNLSSNLSLELGYCEAESLYYVRPVERAKGRATVSFLVKAPLESIKPDKELIDESVFKSYENHFKNLQFDENGNLIRNEHLTVVLGLGEKSTDYLVRFCHFEVDPSQKPSTHNVPNSDYLKLNKLIATRQGACRHRVWAFMALAQALGIKTRKRAVENDCHIIVEAFINNKWVRKDLGGYEADLKILPIHEESKADKVQQEPSTETKQETLEAAPSTHTNENASQPPIISPVPVPTGDAEPTINPNNRFITWEALTVKTDNFDEYLHELIKHANKLPANKRNVLVFLDADQIEAFHQHATQYFQEQGQKSYYLNSLGDISEKTAITNQGKLQTADSQLIQFIKDANPGDALISNWSDYKAAYVGHNSMMDNNRRLKTTDIAEGTLIINVLDKDNAARLGEDFYSRCPIVTECPQLPQENLHEQLLVDIEEQNNYKKAEFYTNDWHALLLGKIAIEGQKFDAQSGLLKTAIDEGCSGLVLTNAPWHLPDFRLFIQELLIKKTFQFNGQEIKLPAGFTLKAFDKEYALHTEQAEIVSQGHPKFCLNQETFKQLFQLPRCHNKQFYLEKGLLEQHKNKELTLLVTEDLSHNHWAYLLKEAGNHQCKLKLMLAKSITVPGFSSAPALDKLPTSHNLIVLTNDLDLAEEQLLAEQPKALVVSVNPEMSYSDLIESIQTDMQANANNPTLTFDSKVSDVWKALSNKNGRPVILKGQLSPTVAKRLETLFLKPSFLSVNGEIQQCKQALTLLTHDEQLLPWVDSQRRTYTEEDYWQALSKAYSKSEEQNLNRFKTTCDEMQAKANVQFKYGQLRSMFNNIKANAESNPFKPFFRLQPDERLQQAAHIWKKNAIKPKRTVEEKRRRKLDRLNHSPYVFIAGPSGVGKSTYVLKELGKDRNNHIQVGLDNIESWLKDKEQGKKILFIDEANLEAEGKCAIFEGIFNKKPGILWKGTFYPLSPQHKIVFAGNFSHFAGRHHHEFFEMHGQIYNFKELPPEYLAEHVLAPALNVCASALSTPDKKKVTDLFLKLYASTNEKFSDHPVTPRNLKMMCLRLGLYLERKANYAIEELAYAAAMDEIASIIDPAEELSPENPENLGYEQIRSANNASIPGQLNHFIVTESRKNAVRLLHDQFVLRAKKLNAAKQYEEFEIPGLLIEGPSGIGKSELAISYLKSLDYQDGFKPETQATDSRTRYYHLTPTDPAKMQATLLKAFHEGAVVIIDELNSLPLESVINQLLSGVDLKGKEANTKGFFLIATQNPAGTFIGRSKLSVALENRHRKIYLPDYAEDELKLIAQHLAPDQQPEDAVAEYSEAKTYAQYHGKFPAPTPRHLFAELIDNNKALNADAVISPEIEAMRKEAELQALPIVVNPSVASQELDNHEAINAFDAAIAHCRETLANDNNQLVEKLESFSQHIRDELASSAETYETNITILNHFTPLLNDLAKNQLTRKEFENSLSQLDRELFGKPLMSQSTKILIGTIIGAIVGLIVGAVVGAVLTGWSGGWGALPAAILAAAKGASIGTTLAAGGTVAGSTMAGFGGGFFVSHYHKSVRKQHQKEIPVYNELEDICDDIQSALKN